MLNCWTVHFSLMSFLLSWARTLPIDKPDPSIYPYFNPEENLDANVFLTEGDILIQRKRSANMYFKTWYNRSVPYSFGPNMDLDRQRMVEDAMFDIQNSTCIRFKRTESEKDYIQFIVPERGCYSPHGRTGGPQVISLADGCWVHGIIQHEILHALGLWHEHSRRDRDDYIKVNWDNIDIVRDFPSSRQGHDTPAYESAGEFMTGDDFVEGMEFAVEMRSPCCADKVKKALEGMTGIKTVNVDIPSQRVIVEGDVVAEIVKDTVETKTGMSTVLLGHGTSLQNLGAGVAAISVGTSGVQGLLRFIQSDPETCIIEGTLDKVPTSEPLYLTLHETGDISSGCESCGSLFKSQGFNGFLSQLHPKEDKSAEFRVAAPNIKLSDMIGHCVVIHKGEKEDIDQNKSERLACGIVARASGLFQNSKRFCACDGVTIWEQKQRERESKNS